MNKEILNSLHYYVLQFIRDNTTEGIESLLGHKKTAVLSQAMAFANKEIRKVGEETLREEKRLLKEIQSLDATNEANAAIMINKASLFAGEGWLYFVLCVGNLSA